MNKREFQKQFGDKATELLSNPTFHIALDVAREDCPYVSGAGVADATAIIRNEGRMTGWNECLKFLKTIGKSDPEPAPVVETRRYSDPDPRKAEQNKK